MRGLLPLRHGLPGPLHRHRGGRKPLARPRKSIPQSFTIDELRCIFCGMCEEACPVDAIELTSLYDLSGKSREEMIFDKEKLLSVYDQTKDAEPMSKTVEQRGSGQQGDRHRFRTSPGKERVHGPNND